MVNDGRGLKKVYVGSGFRDVGRGIEGLGRMIGFELEVDGYDKNRLLLFWGKGREGIKGVMWEGDGFVVVYKGIENGKLGWGGREEEGVEMSGEEYGMLMEGVEMVGRDGIEEVGDGGLWL